MKIDDWVVHKLKRYSFRMDQLVVSTPPRPSAAVKDYDPFAV